MLKNRSLPPGSIFPELVYPDLGQAVEWLCRVFRFKERLRIGDHRCQLVFADASLIAVGGGVDSQETQVSHSVMLRVENVDEHCELARRNGAKIVRDPETHPFGERQYTAEDLGRHRWTFTQTVVDVAPEEWGGKLASGMRLRSAAQTVMLDHLAIPVAQVDRSRDWYVHHLHLEVEFEIPQHKTVALKDDGRLTLFLYERPNVQGSTSCTLTFQVHECGYEVSRAFGQRCRFRKITAEVRVGIWR